MNQIRYYEENKKALLSQENRETRMGRCVLVAYNRLIYNCEIVVYKAMYNNVVGLQSLTTAGSK